VCPCPVKMFVAAAFRASSFRFGAAVDGASA
jgi:hypothetical protein